MTSESQIVANLNKIQTEHLDFLKKNLVLKDEAISNIKERKTLIEQQCNDIRNFIIRNANADLKKIFFDEGF